jgi:hypothetical protein
MFVFTFKYLYTIDDENVLKIKMSNKMISKDLQV